ncbi:hypothetical protein [Salininema proteolyticum]|uniref:Uncharacterized protein n=1 Tax=Salininema proteolyticum TaxID=1607685 RepID=A0ABV8U387_9ACTN
MSDVMTLAGVKAATAGHSMIDTMKRKIDSALVRYDGWFLVLIAVILALGATLLAGMAVWCLVNEKGRFSGNFRFANGGFYVEMECIR